MSEQIDQLIKTPGKFGENFMLEREIGRGGMGGVYLGRDVMLDRPVAVKVMLKQYGEDEEFLSSFKREAQAAAKLIHPNIAQIYSYGVVDDRPYIAMELVAGGSLLQIMQNAPDGKTDIPRVLKICEQVAQALRCAADQGLVHGDIKPDNILLDSNGNAKLVDFGLAGMQKGSDEIWGTPYYIAPEKLRKESVDYRADMYNLGGTLYHALTGVAPFEGPDANAVVRKRFEGKPRNPSEIRPEISPAIDSLVLKMLELEKQDRYPTFEALLADFKEVMATGLDTTASAIRSTMTTGNKLKTSGRRLTVRGTRKLTSVRTNVAKMDLDGENATVPPEDVVGTSDIDMSDSAEEEDSNIGRKVITGVIGGIAVIGLLAGGIAWYVVSSHKAKAEAEKQAVITQVRRGHEAIENTRRVAEKFGRDFEEFAAKATEECEKATKKISEVVPEYANRLKPAPSAELLAAIALTNTPVAATGVTNGVAAVSNALTKVATPVAAVATGGLQIKPFRPPTDAEADPASPEHAEYEKLKKQHMEEQMKFFKAAMEKPEKAAADIKEAAKKSAPAADEEDLGTSDDPIEKLRIQLKKVERKYKRELGQVGEEAVKDVNDLWNRAYSCQASVIRIKLGVNKVVETADKAKTLTENNEETMNALGALSSEVTDLYNQVKGSKDVENVQKGISFIKSKGAKSLKQTTDNLYRRRAETEREKKKLEYEISKLVQEQNSADARKKLVAEEQEMAKSKFDALQSNKNFELLQWDPAIRELEFLKSNFKTPEGGIAADDQLKKIKAMKSVQEILVKNMKKYQFKKSKLGKLKAFVREANMKEIQLSRPDSKNSSKVTNFKINWVRFYKEYHANFNELIIQFIENGRKNCAPRLTLAEWGDAMCGAALTLKIVCSDDPAAATRGEQIAKNVAKSFPNYVKTLRMMFPDITFEDVPEE